MLSLEQGRKLVKAARATVDRSIRQGKFVWEKVEERELQLKKGIFITIRSFPTKTLRGCVGFTGKMPLAEAVQKAAYASAFKDTRFLPLSWKELGEVVFEVSILEDPELIRVKDPKKYFERVKLGRDGLMIQNGPHRGLLLPNVPKELDWDVEEFLENLCLKAGLTPDYIYDESTKIWKFQTQIFAEKEPMGKVEEIRLE